MKRCLGIIIGMVVAVSTALPVKAAVTVSLTAKPSSYSGSCPTTVKFFGKITSTNAYTNVTPKFTRSDGTSVTKATQVIGIAGGSVTLADSMSVSSTTSAGFDRLDVSWTYVQTGQTVSGKSSAQATFAVDCSPGGLSDFMKHLIKIGSTPNYLNIIAKPTNLRTTNNPQDCPAGPLGAVAIACATAIRQGQIIFMWDWSPGKGPADITGYHLYRLTPRSRMLACRTCTGRTLVATQDSGPDTMVKGAAPLPGCYVLRAYKGSNESIDSNPKCLGAGVSTGGMTIGLTPVVQTGVGDTGSATFAPGCGLNATGIAGLTSATLVLVGYSNMNTHCTTDDVWYRGYMTFPVGLVAHKPIFRAMLRFKHVGDEYIQGSQYERGFEYPHAPVSCASSLYVGTQQFLDMPSGQPGQSVSEGPLTMVGGTTFSVDVTSLVRDWAANGVTSATLSLRGPKESYAEGNNICTTTYGPFAISVETF